MTQVIAFAGKAQSGKTTCSNYVHGYLMKQNLVVEDFKINDLGQLVVTALFRDEEGNPKKDMGVLDLSQKTPEFEAYASHAIWPIVKGYNFADTLKEVCMAVLGLTHEQCYGTNDDKNSLTDLRWENMPGVVERLEDKYGNSGEDYGLFTHTPGLMTAREVLQYVGTEIFRKMKQSVWVDSVFNQIEFEQPQIATIADCRFKNEAEAVKQRGGFVVHLLRNSDSDNSHASENDLVGWDGFDYVIDNRNLSIQESNLELLKFLVNKNIVKALTLS